MINIDGSVSHVRANVLHTATSPMLKTTTSMSLSSVRYDNLEDLVEWLLLQTTSMATDLGK